MSHHYATPGVYIEEQTSPGVIAGVSTSTAAFIGPTLNGPFGQPVRITSYDEFVARFGATTNDGPQPHLFVQERPYYMGFAVQGFFQNGGQYAYIVRVGTGTHAVWRVLNREKKEVFKLRARQAGQAANTLTFGIQPYGQQSAVNKASAELSADANSTAITVRNAVGLRIGDMVTIVRNEAANNQAQIRQINGNTLILTNPLADAKAKDVLRIADFAPTQTELRLTDTTGLRSGPALISNGTVTERVMIKTIDSATKRVTLADTPARTATYALAQDSPSVTFTNIRPLACPPGHRITNVNGAKLTLERPANGVQFRVGDIVTVDGSQRTTVVRVEDPTVTLAEALTAAQQNTTALRIADILPQQLSFRVSDSTGLYPGTVALLRGNDADNPANVVQEYVVLQNVDSAGFVTLDASEVRSHTYAMNAGADAEPVLIPQDFSMSVTGPKPADSSAVTEIFEALSLNPVHPRYVLNEGLVQSNLVQLEPPNQPPTTASYPDRLVMLGKMQTPTPAGQNDQPSNLTAGHYQAGLNLLLDVDDVNLVCIPDAATHVERETIQDAIRLHCEAKYDRFAVLDALKDADPASVEQQRLALDDKLGFAALYYPWLTVRDPRDPKRMRTLAVPPCGHMAGLLARTDVERGVHKAPANIYVNGVLGLERQLSDRQQGPLNLAGINVLRIFPGEARATVWGARTTCNREITDWRYIATRRLLLYIEESIERGIRWAVFEPNNLTLWQKLKRSITEFLTRVWRSGALFGATAEEAFYVRIDEALNTPATQALGQLHIEIGVRPAYPAEFVIVRIGLWSGGASISEA